ncbi:MAG: hypothetical protein MK214_09025 [Thalassotalea sp.]|nr:hypothetical protein [Thalassotalea sp.]
MKKTLCNINVVLAIIFASLMIAIALLTKGNENGLFITFILTAGYFASLQAVKKHNQSIETQ